MLDGGGAVGSGKVAPLVAIKQGLTAADTRRLGTCALTLALLAGCGSGQVSTQAPDAPPTAPIANPSGTFATVMTVSAVPITAVPPEVQAVLDAKHAMCKECHVLTQAELDAEANAARNVPSDEIPSASQANVPATEAKALAETARQLAERSMRLGVVPANRGDHGQAAVDRRKAKTRVEVDKVWSTKMPVHQREAMLGDLDATSDVAEGGKPETRVQLAAVNVVVDGAPYAVRSANSVTIVAQAHMEVQYWGDHSANPAVVGQWSWTLVNEAGQWRLLHQVTPPTS
jgi:hypothetical protein